MMACADRHTHFVDDSTQVVGMYTLNDKGNQAATTFGLSDETDAFNFRKLLDGGLQKLSFVFLNCFPVKALKELNSRFQTKSRTHIRSTRLEFVRAKR